VTLQNAALVADLPSRRRKDATKARPPIVHPGVTMRRGASQPGVTRVVNRGRMRRRTALFVAALAVGSSALTSLPGTSLANGDGGRGHGRDRPPTLLARATLSADFIAPGPPSGALATPANGRTGPFPGQVIPGFSGVVDNGDGTFWAMPDNGFGAKANSADFFLRLYQVRPRWATARGGTGTIDVGPFISLRDPDRKLPFPIVNGATPERLLTGADFDIESVQRGRDGSFWIGEEFGPFIVHVDRTGKVLAAPYEFPDGKSPANPLLLPGEAARVRSSGGFEAMAMSQDGRYLYPIVENSFVDDPLPRRRFIYEFDTRMGHYTGTTWQYEVDTDDNLVGDAFTVRNGVLTVIERDNFEGPASVTKRLYRVDLRHTDQDGFVTKELVLDLLKIANPAGIGADPTAYGLGDPFAFALQSFESAIELRDGTLLVANDNNYPGSAGRRPGTPDDTEMVIVDPGRPAEAKRPDAATVIGHRGASGYRPEHTLASYEQAILMCADFIEPDLVSTKDGVLVARHENEISGTTDVAARPEFAARRTTKVVDGTSITGWFTEDFTLAELRTLRAVERLPAVRPANTAFDKLYRVPTFDEVLDLARHSRTCDGRQVGVYPETKHPSYFDSLGLSLEEPLVAALDHDGLGSRRSPVIIQSFETANLRQLDTMTDVRLAQLADCSGAPWDFRAAGDPRTYADLVTPAGLADIAGYADGVGLCKDRMIPRDANGFLLPPTSVIGDAHAVGLIVHGWTFRRENQFLPADFRSSADPIAVGDLAGEINTFLDAGMDAFFTDNPDLGAATVDAR
jgi:glycerophosphoryl diester phosphodiesterase